ncbi:hypothetical protein [Candidatus Thalassolituus haligoni]|uniref:hypothetical protein n=1 Tax=Candidatus Thalassolituus haligoni TaxID=3100113 RepID=UPI0035164B48
MYIRKSVIEKIILLFFFMMVNEFFFLTDNKLSGVPFAREFFLVILVAVFLWLAVLNRCWIGVKEEYFVVLYVIGWIVVSPILAWLFHGQPFYFGVLEERRVILYLVFFPVFYILLYSRVSLSILGNYIVLGFFFSSLVGWFYYFGLISPRVDLSFKVDGKSYNDVYEMYEGFRGGRFRIATAFIVWVFVYSLLNFRKNGRYLWAAIIFYCALYVWFVIQTRTLMATMFISALFVFRKRIDRIFSVFIAVVPLVFVVFLIYPDVFQSELDKLLLLYEDAVEHSGPRTREITIGIIIDEILKNPVGYGALSLQWKDGFLPIYNDNFYLSDVGIFGVFYRFGFFSLVVIGIYYYVYLSRAVALRKSENALVLTACYVVVIESFDLIFSSSMAMGGGVFGVALAVMAFKYYGFDNK